MVQGWLAPSTVAPLTRAAAAAPSRADSADAESELKTLPPFECGPLAVRSVLDEAIGETLSRRLGPGRLLMLFHHDDPQDRVGSDQGFPGLHRGFLSWYCRCGGAVARCRDGLGGGRSAAVGGAGGTGRAVALTQTCEDSAKWSQDEGNKGRQLKAKDCNAHQAFQVVITKCGRSKCRESSFRSQHNLRPLQQRMGASWQ
jgi:hypothetical protein